MTSSHISFDKSSYMAMPDSKDGRKMQSFPMSGKGRIGIFVNYPKDLHTKAQALNDP